MRHQKLFSDKFNLNQMSYSNKVHNGTQSPLALSLDRANGTDLCNRVYVTTQSGLYAITFQ